MGGVKDERLKQAEPIMSEIERLIEQIEDEISQGGIADKETSNKLATAFYEFGKLWPEDDMKLYGKALLDAVTRGLETWIGLDPEEQLASILGH